MQKTVSYGYDEVWKDLLKSYDGQAIAYDWVKNPLTWRDGLAFTWSNGRQLTGATKDGTALSFGYNSDGLRLHKTVGTTRTDYEWDGSALLAEQTGNNKILYLYHGTGLIGFKRNGVTYTYVYNGLGDVMEILDKDGNAVVSYLYDAWGAPISITGPMASTLGVQNPIRYRGYYYDTETGLYYLQSRYYDPVVGRFINADGYVSTGQGILGTNMFAYCNNNPVNRSDPFGQYWIGNLSGKRYDSLSCTTRYEMQLYDGGIGNCTKYADDVVFELGGVYMPHGGETKGGVITEHKGVSVQTDKVTFIPPHEVKDFYKRTNSYWEQGASVVLGAVDLAAGTKVSGALLLLVATLQGVHSEMDYRDLCAAIETASQNGTGLVIISAPYCNDPRANAGRS